MKPYTITKLNDYTWQIAEIYHTPAALPMYLIVGTERAALIDTGMGHKTLRKTVEEITDLPVTVYNTHIHLDHSAGNNLFDWVCMHKEEEPAARRANAIQDRIEFVELKCMYDPDCDEILDSARKNLMEYDPDYEITFIDEGDRIDLGGGIVLEPIHCPGHTHGSLVYLDRKGKNAFCGDTMNPRSSIGMWPGSPKVSDYVRSLYHLLEKTEEIEHFYGGHRLYSFGREDVKDVLTCAEEIVAGVPAEPCAIVMSRKGPLRGWIHWYNGKRITYQKENVK